MPFGIDYPYLEALKDYFAGIPSVGRVILFGSRAKGNFTDSSDCNILIQTEESIELAYQKIKEDLDQLQIPHKLSIQINPPISKAFQDHLTMWGVELFIR